MRIISLRCEYYPNNLGTGRSIGVVGNGKQFGDRIAARTRIELTKNCIPHRLVCITQSNGIEARSVFLILFCSEKTHG